MGKNSDQLYEVGYKKPPADKRFRKGQSGNPKGRPKSAKTLGASFERVLDMPQPLTIEGDQTTVTKREAIAWRLVKKGLEGDVRALKLLLPLIRAIEPKHERPKLIVKVADY